MKYDSFCSSQVVKVSLNELCFRYLCSKTHQIPMNDLLVALQLMESEEIELEEAHCILANLINDGKVKGYISIQHQKLVLSKIDPFPKLSTLN